MLFLFEDGQDVERRPVSQPVDGEAATIQGEDALAAELLGQRDQCGIGIVHREIEVLRHQLCCSPQTVMARRNQDNRAAQDEVDRPLLPTWVGREKVESLCKYRFGGERRFLALRENLHASQVLSLVAIEQCDERAGVE
jgi:hypothetical protein